MFATDFLVQSHRDIEELLREVPEAEEADVMAQKRKDLADMLMAHFFAMSEVFFSVAEQFANENAIPRALEEQAAITYMLWRLMQAPLDRAVFQARLDVLRDMLMNHMEEQESELFLAVRNDINKQDHYRLGDKTQKSYEEALRIGYAPLMAKQFAALPPIHTPTKAKTKPAKPLRFVQITSDGSTLAGLTKTGRVYRRDPHTNRWIPSTMMLWKAKKAQ